MTVDHSKQIIYASLAATVLGYLVYRKVSTTQAKKPRTLLERIGGEPAVEAAVELFYKKMLSDPRVKRFFEKTNMVHQRGKQRNFLLYVLDAGNRHKYHGLSMDRAHRRLIKEEGLNDSHFDATAENLNNTFIELGVPDDVRTEVITAVAGLRDQVLCRGKWAEESPEEKAASASRAAAAAAKAEAEKSPQKTLYERLGGEAAVEAAVDKFYARMLADPRVNRFFKDTNMSKQHMKQVAFMSYAFGAPKKYSGLAMDAAHRRLVEKEGMNDSHFDAVAENLLTTLTEMGVPKDLRDEAATAVGGLREQVMCRGQWARKA
jgi:hemoglobin